MKKNFEKVTEKHLNILIEELSDKNITGIRLIKQDDKIMLLLDKSLLSKTNEEILNALNATYPNIIVDINDISNPFDYEELYETDPDPKKVNMKVRPFLLYLYSVQQEISMTEYFNRFKYAGIEINIKQIPVKWMQLGYFLEFINAFQEQDVNYEQEEVLDEETIKRHEHYLRNGSPDKRHISLLVSYNEELLEYSNGLKVSDDPYLSKLFITVLNSGASSVNSYTINLCLENINKNVQDYLNRKFQDNNEMIKIQSRNIRGM